MGQSRTWNGNVANYLNTVDQVTNQVGLISQAAWIRPAALGITNTIFGNSYDAGYGWRISSSNRLELFWSNGTTYDFHKLSVPLLVADGASQDFLQVDTPLFVAINITSYLSPTSADFYAGITPNGVTLLGSQGGGASVTTNEVQMVAIGVNMLGLTPDVAFNW